MKVLVTLLALSLSFWGLGQSLTEKDMNYKGSYGEKKFAKSPKKVYISKFQVYFQVSASATATTSGGRQLGGGSYRAATSTTMAVAIDGVDVPDFQAITDEVYQQFTDDLSSNGFEIIPTEQVTSIPFYEGWTIKNGGEVNYANVPDYVSVTPTGTKYMVKKETKKGKEKNTFVDRTPAISAQLDDAIVAEVIFAFPTIDMDAKGGVYAASSKVKAYVDYHMGSAYGQDGLSSGFAQTKVKFASGKGPGAAGDAYFVATLKKPKFNTEAPVFKDKVFKERSLGSTAPAYYGIVFQDKESTQVTHTTAADHDLYVSESKRLISEFLEQSMTEFYSYAKK